LVGVRFFCSVTKNTVFRCGTLVIHSKSRFRQTPLRITERRLHRHAAHPRLSR
jgi:hypothetical protein